MASRLFYGLTSSTSLAQIGLELIAENEEKQCPLCKDHKNTTQCPGLSHEFARLVSDIYVDDIFWSSKDEETAQQLMDYVTNCLEKYAYSLKGWNFSFKVNSKDDPCLDADLLM